MLIPDLDSRRRQQCVLYQLYDMCRLLLRVCSFEHNKRAWISPPPVGVAVSHHSHSCPQLLISTPPV